MKKSIFFVFAILIGFGGYLFYSSFFKEKDLAFDLHHSIEKDPRFKEWVMLNPKGQPFSASFPSEPTKVSRDLPIPGSQSSLEYHEFQCKGKGNRLFSVSYTTLPNSFLKWGDNLVLSGALKLMMKELGKVHLVGKSSNTFKSFPALDYEHYTKELETAGTLILVENTLYKVEVTYPLNDRDGCYDELCNFIASFNPAEPLVPLHEKEN